MLLGASTRAIWQLVGPIKFLHLLMQSSETSSNPTTKSLVIKLTSSWKKGLPLRKLVYCDILYFMISVKFLSILLGHFCHLNVSNYEAAFLNKVYNFSNCSVCIGLYHGEGSMRLTRS